MQQKEKASRGGIATAKSHSKEWLQNRAYKAGTTVRDMYGTDYYRHINSKRKVHRGWPKGKLRKVTKDVLNYIKQADLPPQTKAVLLDTLDEF